MPSLRSLGLHAVAVILPDVLAHVTTIKEIGALASNLKIPVCSVLKLRSTIEVT